MRRRQRYELVFTVNPGVAGGGIGDVKRIRDANPGMSLKEAWVLAGRPGLRMERRPIDPE